MKPPTLPELIPELERLADEYIASLDPRAPQDAWYANNHFWAMSMLKEFIAYLKQKADA